MSNTTNVDEQVLVEYGRLPNKGKRFQIFSYCLKNGINVMIPLFKFVSNVLNQDIFLLHRL